MLTFSLLAARSISMAATPAWPSLPLEIGSQAEILVEKLRILLLGVPPGPPGLVEPQTESVRVYLLPHDYLPASTADSARFAPGKSSSITTWHDRLRIR